MSAPDPQPGRAVNRVRPGFYLDSVALMRIARDIAALPGIAEAALMVGTPSNRAILADAGLLAPEGERATPRDLILAVRTLPNVGAGEAPAVARAALEQAEALLERPRVPAGDDDLHGWRPRTLRGALAALPEANLALISVPGAHAAAEARKALRAGLHTMIFSDNVPLAEEAALKREAAGRGLLVMGPDCGTAIVGGVPLGFANRVPRGGVGIVSASGTGLQEVACLLARLGKGVSHALGTGGRDLHAEVGGATTLAALDALDADPATGHVVWVSKPPDPAVAARVAERIGRSRKPFTVCLLGQQSMALPPNATLVPTLCAAAEHAAGQQLSAAMEHAAGQQLSAAAEHAAGQQLSAAEPTPLNVPAGRGAGLLGLFAGGTLCGEAQVMLLAGGLVPASNIPVPGAVRASDESDAQALLLDLGADEYTVGRPHPMIDPTVRNGQLARALADPRWGVLLLDVVLGCGAHPDPAGEVARVLAAAPGDAARPLVIASVCGTGDDPQPRPEQVATLEGAGVRVAASNAGAVRLALNAVQSSRA